MDHFQSPRNGGRMPDPDRVGTAGVPGQGRFLTLYLRVEGDRVAAANFEANGCGITIACGSALTEMIIGHSLPECLNLAPHDLERTLDGLPADKRDCAVFAIHALKSAIEN